MRITGISIKGLFGSFDHTIPLKPDRITIIHGPNGLGKTILLQIVLGLFKRRYAKLMEIPFQSLEIKFDDGSILWVEKEIRDGNHQQTLFEDTEIIDVQSAKFWEITINYIQKGERDPKSFVLNPRADLGIRKISPSVVEDLFPFLERLGPRS